MPRTTSTSSPPSLLAILGNSVGTLAVVAVALATIRRRPIGNSLILVGVAVAAVGTALLGLGEGCDRGLDRGCGKPPLGGFIR